MPKLSLTLKITTFFIGVSIVTLLFLYMVFYNLFETRLLEAEKRKAELIAQTIEPTLALNHYFGLKDESIQLLQQTLKHQAVLGLEVTINTFMSWKKLPVESDIITINYPIQDSMDKHQTGNITLHYTKEDLTKSLKEVQTTILIYLTLLAVIFVIFALSTRYLLNPLQKIAKEVQTYQPGSSIDFSDIRKEKETQAITEAFKGMLGNIREYTALLERYKLSVDESAIVCRMSVHSIITYANETFCQVSGYDRQDLIGRSFNTLIHPDMSSQIFPAMQEQVRHKQIWKGTLKNLHKDGTAFYVKATMVPILDDHSEIIEVIGILHDITQIIKQQEQISRQTTDFITGLPNRTKLIEDIERLQAPKFALIALDDYNIIKDYYGVQIGNQTITETSHLIQEYLNREDIAIYKLASGEFGLLVGEQVSVDTFKKICADIIHKIDNYIVHAEENSFNISATSGLTFTPDNLLSNASLALMHAKKTRKSHVIFEDTDNLIHHYENNLMWTKKLKAALQEDRIKVFVQPIVNAQTLQTDKYECLVRLQESDGKIISPFFFLDIAKQSKQYHHITRSVIAQSFKAFAAIANVEFSINLSVEDMLHTETQQFLKEQLEHYNIAHRVVLEIVESEGIEEFQEITQCIAELKSLGCKIAIDDFGTGYSNFAYLMQLNVDYIKVDGSLIKEIHHDPNSHIISQTILNFAKELEIATIAEFVHNQSVQDHVTKMGFNYLQGFHLSEPFDIEQLVQNSRTTQ